MSSFILVFVPTSKEVAPYVRIWLTSVQPSFVVLRFYLLTGCMTSGIGFVDDIRRMNVAITRAREALFIVGNAKSLSQSAHWKELITNTKQRQAFLSIDQIRKLQP